MQIDESMRNKFNNKANEISHKSSHGSGEANINVRTTIALTKQLENDI